MSKKHRKIQAVQPRKLGQTNPGTGGTPPDKVDGGINAPQQSNPEGSMTPSEKTHLEEARPIQCPLLNKMVEPQKLCWRTEELVHNWHLKREARWTILILAGFAATVLAGGNWVWRRADETRDRAVAAAERMAVKVVSDSNSVKAIQTQANVTIDAVQKQFAQSIGAVVRQEDGIQARLTDTQNRISQEEASNQVLAGRLTGLDVALTNTTNQMTRLAIDVNSLYAQATGMTGPKSRESLQLIHSLVIALDANDSSGVKQLMELRVKQEATQKQLDHIEVLVQQCLAALKSRGDMSWGAYPYLQGAVLQQEEAQRLQSQSQPWQSGYPQPSLALPAGMGNVTVRTQEQTVVSQGQKGNAAVQSQGQSATSQAHMGNATLPSQMNDLLPHTQAGSMVQSMQGTSVAPHTGNWWSQTQAGSTITQSQMPPQMGNFLQQMQSAGVISPQQMQNMISYWPTQNVSIQGQTTAVTPAAIPPK